jgi:hypothetical protein
MYADTNPHIMLAITWISQVHQITLQNNAIVNILKLMKTPKYNRMHPIAQTSDNAKIGSNSSSIF